MDTKFYIKRDKDNQIIAIAKEPLPDFTEAVDDSFPIFCALLGLNLNEILSQNEHIYSDIKMIRVLDDLIEILISKNIIKLTDLPEVAQQKLVERKKSRAEINELIPGNPEIDAGTIKL